MRNCEVCGKNDLATMVHSSSVAGASFNFCSCCSPMGAEPSGLVDSYISYDSNSDSYYDESDNHMEIVLANGLKFQTRGEYVKWREENKNG